MIMFTVRNISEELKGEVDFELLAVDNFCDEIKTKQGTKQDRSGAQLAAVMRGHPWLNALEYTHKLSHWNAKNYGVEKSTGDILWFCDSHCQLAKGSLVRMFRYYEKHHEELNGTLHLPLTYHIMEYRRLVYKLAGDISHGDLHYSFTPFRESAEGHFRVPCMSTCGMMMTRKLYDQLGGWPQDLGIYGGGENFINYTLAVLGRNVNVFTDGLLHHHGDKRGYYWYGDDYTKNRCIANYMFGGQEWAKRFIKFRKGDKPTLNRIYEKVLGKNGAHRKLIADQQLMEIEEWLLEWDWGSLQSIAKAS